MKKFLALVLALVMTMSLVTIAGAEDYTDADSMNYAEAVEVMSAAGVVGGYADGSFNPQAGLTRGAAAKIICNMILGPTTAEALVANDAPYSDVAVDNVFAGYIAYCANEGIISGYADGTFKPAAPLTGYAFMKMLLGALGYDAAIEGYTGSNWSIQVAKRALAIGLDDGLVSKFVGNKALTREEACLYAFNAMNTLMVKYDTKSTISVGDIVISQNSEAEEVGPLFREKYFEDLTKSTAVVTEAGRPAHTWKWDRDTIGTYADTADYVLVLDKDYSEEADALAVIQELTENEDLTWDYNAAGKQITDLYVDGKNCNGEDYAAAAVQGNVVELYVDKYDAIEDVVAFTYDLLKIEKVSTSLTKAQKEDGATCKVTFSDDAVVLDTEIVGFDADTYVKGAYVLVCYNAAEGKDEHTIIDSQLAEVVEGTVATKKGSDVTIDGVAYETLIAIALKDSGKFYLNLAGQIMLKDVESKSDDYAYIYNVVTDGTGLDEDGDEGSDVKVYLTLTDGSKKSYVVDADYESAVAAKKGDVVAYSINSDGEFELETEKDTIANGVAMTANKTDADGTLSTTVFVFSYDNEDGKRVADVVTGYKGVDINTATQAHTVTDADGKVLYVFIAGENGTVNSDALLAVLVDAEPVEDENAKGDDIFTYTVVVDGAETTLTFEDALDADDYVAGTVFAYELDGDYAVIDTDTDLLTDDSVDAANDSYVKFNGTQYNLGTETVYTIYMEYEDEAAYEDETVDTVTVEDDGVVEKEDQVVFTLKDGDLDVIFVYEYIY